MVHVSDICFFNWWVAQKVILKNVFALKNYLKSLVIEEMKYGKNYTRFQNQKLVIKSMNLSTVKSTIPNFS